MEVPLNHPNCNCNGIFHYEASMLLRHPYLSLQTSSTHPLKIMFPNGFPHGFSLKFAAGK